MTATASRTAQRRLCSVLAREQGHDPIGTAWAVERMLLVELALPWPEDFFDARAFPPGLGEKLLAIWDRHPDTELLGIAPDPEYSREGWSRVIDFRFGASPRAATTRAEFLIPDDRLGELVAALFEDGASARSMPFVETVPFTGRDLLVCTHGTVDACCAMFGYPLFRDLRRIAQETAGACRVWRSTHFGGHRFAPTVIDFPEGRFWGFLDAELGESLVLRRGEAAALGGSYRGWAGYAEPKAQVLEREALVREGWAWTTWPQSCEVLEQDEQGNMLLRLTAFPPSGVPIVYEGWIEVTGSIDVMHSTDSELAEEPVFTPRAVRRVLATR